MKIETKFEIGDPVCVLDCCQRDGYSVAYRGFRWQDIPNVGKYVFGTYAEAKQAEDRLNNEMFVAMSKRD